MDQQTRTLLKAEIEVYLAKFPDASVNQVLKFIKTGKRLLYSLDPEIQAPKMADFWPIENVWAILKQKVASKSTNNVKELRAAITTAWIEISKDKKLCKKMIDSLPVRAQAVISKNGRQIFKKDYQ